MNNLGTDCDIRLTFVKPSENFKSPKELETVIREEGPTSMD